MSAARTVFEVSGYELHARTGSSGRQAMGSAGSTQPPAGDALGTIDPLGTNATQTLGTTVAPPQYEPAGRGGRGGNAAPEPLPPAWAGHPVSPPMARRRRKLWPWILMAVIFLAGLGVGGYFVFTRDEAPTEPEIPNFLPRPSSVFPEELPAQIAGFRKIIDRLDKVEANEGFTGRLGALYKNNADQQVFHSVVRYPTVEEADAERETELDYFLNRGYTIEEEILTKQALGRNVGELTYLRRTDSGFDLEAIVWSNDKLAAVVRGPRGAVVDLFNELAY